jgi:RNase H-fold protein (predicted Holliday junction resolvase)
VHREQEPVLIVVAFAVSLEQAASIAKETRPQRIESLERRVGVPLVTPDEVIGVKHSQDGSVTPIHRRRQ